MDLKKWFAEVVASALKQGIVVPKQMLAHVKPDVLSRHLPTDLMSKVLGASLRAKAMTPDGVLNVVTPKLLAAHIPLSILWGCIVQDGEASGLKGNGSEGSAKQKEFLRVVLSSGLECKVLTPEDIVRHANPDVLAGALTISLKTKLLQAGLEAPSMTPSLIVDTLGTKALAEQVPVPILWACVHEAGTKAVGTTGDEAAVEAVEEIEDYEDPEEWVDDDVLVEEFEEATNA